MKSIIIANGKAPGKSLVTKLIKRGYNFIVCADGGANSAFKMNLIPDLIIGDMDSINVESLEFFSGKRRIKKISRQNDTDVEKALKYLIKKNYKEVVLLGATGDRIDHSFCNLGIVLKFYHQISVKVIHEKSLLVAVNGNISFKSIPGEFISLYGFDNKTKFISRGLKYPLHNITLKFGQTESTSNRSISNLVDLKIKGGLAFLVRDLIKAFECDFI